MRTLDLIQADIRFLLKEQEKANFFQRLFSLNTSRLEELRLEEFRALDLLLYQEHADYKSMALHNQRLLNDTYWELTVTESSQLRDNAAALHGIHGRINAHGYIDCSATVGRFSFVHEPCRLNGQLNYHGDLNISVDQGVSARPIYFSCYSYDMGQLSVVGLSKGISYFNITAPKKLSGDPFRGNTAKRNDFLATRNHLLRILHPLLQS